MAEMIAFSQAMLVAVVDFLGTPPVFYLFSLICFIPVIVIVKKLMRIQ